MGNKVAGGRPTWLLQLSPCRMHSNASRMLQAGPTPFLLIFIARQHSPSPPRCPHVSPIFARSPGRRHRRRRHLHRGAEHSADIATSHQSTARALRAARSGGATAPHEQYSGLVGLKQCGGRSARGAARAVPRRTSFVPHGREGGEAKAADKIHGGRDVLPPKHLSVTVAHVSVGQ